MATFYGVHYDLQGSGDFILVQLDPDLTVQTRHKPVNASVSANTAVAAKMGDTRVALCLPTRLEINGMLENLADGQSIAYGGVLVSRKGNVYEILGPGAAMIQAEIASQNWLNIRVFLGQFDKEKVRGLLGHASGYNLDLAMPDGTVLKSPPSYAEFTHYADSWRVPPAQSLLCNEDKVLPGMPPKPTTARDLDPLERARVEAICTKAGVREGPLLEDCMLDVSVTRDDSAADPFVSLPVPIKEITPTFP